MNSLPTPTPLSVSHPSLGYMRAGTTPPMVVDAANASDLVWAPASVNVVRILLARYHIPFPLNGRLQLLTLSRRGQHQAQGFVAVYKIGSDSSDCEDGRLLWRLDSDLADSDVETLAIRLGVETARSCGIRVLCSQEKISVAAGDPEPLRANGLYRFDSSAVLEAEFDKVYRRTARIYKALKARGAIPNNANITAVQNDAVLAKIRALLERERLLDSYDFDSRLRKSHPQAFSLNHSTVIEIDGQLVGLMLVAPITSARAYSVPVRWVAPAYRQSWLNAVLIHNSVRQGVSLDLDFVRFNANPERHPETLALARKLGGQIIDMRSRFGCRLQPIM